MKILAIDIGTGTQDIFLYDSRVDIENGYKLVLPSPTMQVWQQVNEATREQVDIVLSGVNMGGGPSAWAVEKHLQQGFRVFATPEAAKTFNDDLKKVEAMGVTLLCEEEVENLPRSIKRIKLGDLDFGSIERAFRLFGVSLADLSLVAVGVFDHGHAPVEVSDRKFRFDYLDHTLQQHQRLSALAYSADHIPTILTRMQAVADSAKELPCPLMLMDTAPAAVLGAMLDPLYKEHRHNLVVNIGNGHTLGFRIGPDGIEGVFEHHTGLLDSIRLDQTLLEFASGTLTNQQVFEDHGHGALLYTQDSLPMDHEDFNFIVTGPRQSMAAKSVLKPYFAAPFGDMMLTGCFGMLSAAAEVFPDLADPIHHSFSSEEKKNSAPWDLVD